MGISISGRYHTPIGRSATNFTVVRRRIGRLFLLQCARGRRWPIVLQKSFCISAQKF
jgi:hypothetical protein